MAKTQSLDWIDLAGIGAKSVFTVAACASVGVYARKTGVLTKATEKGLGKLITSVYLPCLIFQKVVPNMNMPAFLDIWPLIVIAVITVFYGLVCGYGVAFVLGLSEKKRGLIMVAIAFPNSFSVPITLMLALGCQPQFGDVSGQEFVEHTNLYFLMSYTLWVLIRWSIGYPILSGALSFREWREKVINPPVKACFLGILVGLLWSAVPNAHRSDVLEKGAPILEPLATALRYAGQCCVPSILLTLGANLDAACEEAFQKKTELDEPLAALANAPGKSSSGERLASDEMPALGYISVLVFRQLVGPLLGAGICCGLIRDVFDVNRPIVLMVGMLQSAGPPMINLAVMAGMSENGETTVAKILLGTYAFSIVSWTCSLAFFLYVLDAGA